AQKQIGEPKRSPIGSTCFPLEADRRRERHPQVVVCAAIEIHFVARFHADSNRPEEGLDAAARICCDVCAGVAELVERPGERRAGSGSVTGSEVKESDFARHESAEWARRSELKFRSEQTGERTQPAGHCCGAASG